MREYNWNALKRIRTERFHWEIARRISICAIFILPILFYLMKIFIYDSMLVFAIFSIISVIVFLIFTIISSFKIRKMNKKIAEIHEEMDLRTFY